MRLRLQGAGRARTRRRRLRRPGGRVRPFSLPLADPAAARDVGRPARQLRRTSIVRALAAPGTPERAETLATFDTALQRLEADTTLSRADRMQALIARVDLVRIDLSGATRAKPRPGAASMPEALLARRARGDGARRPRDHRRLRAPGGHHLGGPPARAGRPRGRIRRPAQGQSCEEPLALLPDVRAWRATPRSAATRPRRCAGTARPSRRARARRRGCSGARATSMRWSSCRRPTKRRSKPPPLQLWREAAALPDAFEQRSGRSLQQRRRKLQAWSQGGAHRASMARLRGELDTLCASPTARERAPTGPRCKSLLTPASRRPSRLTALLAIEHLSVRFGATPVVDDVSFEIAAGEKFALVGESGSGKSITALSVLGLVDGAETQRRDPLRRPRPAAGFRARAARGARRRDRDDLPGADDRAQPAAHDRRADRRGALACTPASAAARRATRAIELLAKTGIPSRSGGSTPGRTSSRAGSGSGR